MRIAPQQEWWSAQELSAAHLPDIPATKRGVNAMAERHGWPSQTLFTRQRAGRGGGWEYHWKLFPVRAQAALLKAASLIAPAEPPKDRGAAWAWFESLPDHVKAEARSRLVSLQRVEELTGPMGRFLAVDAVSRSDDVSPRTLWDWLSRVEGYDVADWLPALAPRHRAAPARKRTATASAQFFDWLKADYLRLGEPSFNSCYDRVVALCKSKGLAVLESRTARRWIEDNVPRVTLVFARQGVSGLEKCFPPQIRDRSGLSALEGVNADCHKIDVFVQWPGIEKPVRPQIVAFQDLYSGKILSYRVDLDPNKVAVMSAFGELIEQWGIPRHCLFDNGREFANKWLTGGTATRFRFKVREDEPLGVLPQMGIQVHWAKPSHGQAKPIERAFGDIADRVALDPRFAGAYVGHKPDAKPEDYGSRAISLVEFLTVLEQGVRDHNARPGRLTPTAKGRSFDETFAESYARAPIRKATPEQHRLWLMGQEVRKLHRTHGSLTLHKNGYWSDWMNEHAGEEVVVRFDPENLHAGIYIYTLAGEFLGPAECREKVGFFDLVGAKLHARAVAQRKRIEKKLLDTIRPVSVGDLAAELSAMEAPLPAPLESKVVEIAPARRMKPVIERPLPVPEAADSDAINVFTADFGRSRVAEPEETVADRFRRLLDIERRSEAGETISAEDGDFWARMNRLPEISAMRALYSDFGEQAIG